MITCRETREQLKVARKVAHICRYTIEHIYTPLRLQTKNCAKIFYAINPVTKENI